MRIASALLALCASCATFIVTPAAHDGGRVTLPSALRIDATGRPEFEVLQERLRVRGVRTEGAPDAPLVSPLGLGSRNTTFTRLFSVPLGILSVATLGLIPLRTARETSFEVQLVDPALQRVVTVRQTFVTASWMWLPLLLSPSHRLSPGDDNRLDRELQQEAFRRAMDEALDELFSQ